MKTIARHGPLVHVAIGMDWDQRRAFLIVRPVRCTICKLRIEAGELVIRTPGDLGYACAGCVSQHVRGQGHCPLCDRLRLSGPKCRACGGTGYGAWSD